MLIIFTRLKKILLITFSFLLFFIIGDLIFSHYIYKEKVEIRYNCFDYKSYKFNKEDYHDYNLLKNCNATEKQRTVIPYKVYTDKDGYRFSGKNRSSKLDNLIFLGDSFTYGYGVKFENSFPGIVESKTNKHEVYNLGVPGYGIQKYYEVLEEFLKNKKASKIFVTLDMTDIHDAAFRWVKIPNTDSTVLKSKHTNKRITNWQNIKYLNFKGTRLLVFHFRNFSRHLKLKLRSKNMGNQDTALKSEIANFTYTEIKNHNELNNKNFKKSLIIINEHFQKISLLAKMNEADLYLIIFPWPETLIYGQKIFNWEDFNNDICEKNYCSKVINLFNDFKKIKDYNNNWKSLLYIDNDVHLKKLGNSLVASKIIKEIN
tara:strand:+ start:75 stop:1193 length:1119 start_codon:yes stop_codon:yes gene_type:complete